MKHIKGCDHCGGNLVLLQDNEGFYAQCILCGRGPRRKPISSKVQGGVKAA